MKNTSISQQSGDNNAKRKISKSIHIFTKSEFIWYFIGVIIRIVWTVIYPQRGYIHPDEFFQGPEVVFDDLFGTNLTRTHEFSSTAPLRSVAILYLLYGLPVSILSYLSSLFQWSSIPFNLKLIFPRVTILLLSLCTDILFYHLVKFFYPKINSKQHGIIMNYYGISHVTLVFFTRTLSNSFESFLFLSLIYLIHKNVSKIESISNRNNKLDRYLILTSSLIGLNCALGIFNRPTYPAFAIIPILYWFTNVILSNRFDLLISQVLSYIIGTFILTSCLLILFDSYYYNKDLSFIMDLKNHLVICPLNFILYNTDSTNLDKHGLHPIWLHFLVSANILYGPLHLGFILWSLSYIIRSNVFEQSKFLFCLYSIPFIPLSMFPHQEPRFLLPLIFPLILFMIPILLRQNLHRYLFPLWFIFNILISFFYGHLHQGGLLPALRYVHDTSVININQKIVVTYHTYMPPGYLVTSMSKSEYEKKFQTIIIDLKGAKREEFDLTIERIFNEYSMKKIQVFVLLPGISRTDIIHLQQQKYSFNLLKQFGIHIDLDRSFEESSHVKYAGTTLQWIDTISNRFVVDVYEVTRG